MKFKIGDRVKLNAIPHENFGATEKSAKRFFEENKDEIFKILSFRFSKKMLTLSNGYYISAKYLKRAPKQKPKIYTINCKKMYCDDCPARINGDVKICEFKGTKRQLEKHIKRYWPQPKIEVVK